MDKDSVSSVYQEGEGSEKSPAVRRQEETLAAESETQSRGSRGPETRPYLSQDKDDMMEMEDIRDCKVTQMEGGQKPNEETMLDNRPKQNQEGRTLEEEELTASSNVSRREEIPGTELKADM